MLTCVYLCACVFSYVSLFTTLRDSLHLYIAISPVYRGPDLESIVHLSFMFFNDCMWMSKHITKLHAHMKMEEMKERRERNNRTMVNTTSKEEESSQSSSAVVAEPAAVASPAMLVDLAAPIRELGERYFLLHLTRQRALVNEFLDSLSNLSTIEEDDSYASATQSLKQTIHQLGTMEKIWCQIMTTTHTQLFNNNANANNDAASKVVTTSSSAPSVPISETVSAIHNGWSMVSGMILELLSSRLVGMVLDKSDISVEAGTRHKTTHIDTNRARAGSLFSLNDVCSPFPLSLCL